MRTQIYMFIHTPTYIQIYIYLSKHPHKNADQQNVVNRPVLNIV